MNLEPRLYHYGLGAGLPFDKLNRFANVFDKAFHANDLKRRRKLAEEMLDGSSWRDFIPKHKGCAPVSAGELPGAQEAIDCVADIIEKGDRSTWRNRPHNPFYQVEKPEHFRDYPALTNFVLSDAILHIISDYYGMVPMLKAVGIWVTPPHSEQFGSQLFHLDQPEAQIVGLFINVGRNAESAGPLTILPADISKGVRSKTQYESVYYRGNGRLSDEIVFNACNKTDQIALGSRSGEGLFADTSNCFHYGSRCHEGERTMLTMKFMLPHKARDTRTALFDMVPEPNDEARRLLLSGANFRVAN